MIKRTMEEQRGLAASIMDVKRCLPILHPLQWISLLKELLEVTDKYYQTVITISHCKKYATQDTLPDIEALITSDLLKTSIRELFNSPELLELSLDALNEND